MQNAQVPTAWKELKIEHVLGEETKLDCEKKKRKRNVKHTSQQHVTGAIANKSQRTSLESRKQEVYEAFDEENVVGTSSKQTVLELSAARNIKNMPSNAYLKSRMEQCVPQLPLQAAKIDKMLMGMTKNLQHIVSQSNYRCTLKGVDIHSITYTNEIHSISKSYEDTYLRQSLNENERACVRGVDCECMQIDVAQPFVGVEFILPWEQRNTSKIGMCLPCLRASTQVLFYDIVHSGVHVNGLIQRYYNEHSKPGEYRLAAMLVCPPSGPIQNLPMPIVRHQRNAYRVFKDKNIFYMKQLEVDFC